MMEDLKGKLNQMLRAEIYFQSIARLAGLNNITMVEAENLIIKRVKQIEKLNDN